MKLLDIWSQSGKIFDINNSAVSGDDAPGTISGNASALLGYIGDPMNQVTGDYLYSHDDLTVGSGAFPYGLGFQRSYDSGRRLQSGLLGL
ncbi:MAG TPA: DUF6531 domain-containing protein, partial [Nitrococcus sp.]|nr:DUF6531 domain-containing protein [Nitrococcus sp.]